MKNGKKLLGIILIGVASFTAFLSVTTAWFSMSTDVNMSNFEGQSEAAYFAGGDGSEDNPYQITNQKHLYNLAWLQYLGYFNEEDESGHIIQTYFTLNDDVDMSGLTLPPIGTTLYPFVGNFDGNGHTIENYTISNEYTTNEIEKKPFRVADVQDVNIVGMFGVVGDIDSTLVGKYDTSTVSISNFYVDNINVRTKLDESLIGVVAGYVNGTLENVGVIDASIFVNTGTSIFDRFERLSEFALIGYCEEQYLEKVTKSITSLHNVVTDQKLFTVQESGTHQGWGGSIDMNSLYTRINSLTYTNVRNYRYDKYETHRLNGSTTNEYETATFYRYKGAKSGSIIMPTTRGQYMYLHGGQTVYPRNEVINGYTLASGNYYINRNGTSSLSAGNNNPTLWNFSATNIDTATSTTIYTTVNNVKYYIRATINNTTATLSLTNNVINATTFNVTRNNGNYGFSYSFTNGRTNYTYYLKIVTNNYNRQVALTDGAIYLTRTADTSLVNIANASYVDYTSPDTYNTYIPLTSESTTDPNASNRNTGYIISGSDDRTTTGTYPNKSGDIRISYYPRSENINTNCYNNGTIKNIKTINSSFSNVDITNESAYEKLSKSKTNFQSVLSSSGANVYGLHFMSANINQNSLVTADYAMINGTEYSNYQFPANCIDFNLKEKGYVNFFAGTYFPNNNSFFSLHKIERTGNNITSIKEISQIYMDNVANHSVVYKFSDGTYSKAYEFSASGVETDLVYTGNYPNGYTLRFDTRQIKVQSSITNKYIYYFEFPMNKGEYALGSVEGGAGAYLMYLDISANALEVNRTKVYEHLEKETSSYQLPKGVSLVSEVSSEDNLDNKDSACFTIEDGYNGTLSLSRTDNDVNVTGNSSTAFASYSGDLVTIKDSGGNVLEAKGFHHEKTIIDRLTMVDYSKTTLDYYFVVVSDIQLFEDDDPVKRRRTYDYLTESLGELPVDKKHIYTDEGNEISESEADSLINIVTSGCDTLIAKYKSTYGYDISYEDKPFISISANEADLQGNIYYNVLGYDVAVTTTGDIDVVISYVGDTYVITINGTEVQTGDIVEVLATA